MTIAVPALRCAIYTRTLGAVARRSLACQLAACRAYINCRSDVGWIRLPGRYSDCRQAITGLTSPALQRLLVQVEDRRIDRLVIDRLSCIGTSASDLSRLMMILDYGGCSLVVASTGIDGATPVGRQVLVTLAAIAPLIGPPELTRACNTADQIKAVSALIRLRAVQTLHAREINTEGQPPCGS